MNKPNKATLKEKIENLWLEGQMAVIIKNITKNGVFVDISINDVENNKPLVIFPTRELQKRDSLIVKNIEFRSKIILKK